MTIATAAIMSSVATGFTYNDGAQDEHVPGYVCDPRRAPSSPTPTRGLGTLAVAVLSP